jgi:hypothetical protein
VDVVVGDIRVPKVDAVYMSRTDKAKQVRAKNPRTPKHLKYGRICVPPTLVIENISKGHESEDRVVKRQYYAEASTPNYWILDVYDRSLECLKLKRKGEYVLDQIGRGKAKVSPACFRGLTIDLLLGQPLQPGMVRRPRQDPLRRHLHRRPRPPPRPQRRPRHPLIRIGKIARAARDRQAGAESCEFNEHAPPRISSARRAWVIHNSYGITAP